MRASALTRVQAAEDFAELAPDECARLGGGKLTFSPSLNLMPYLDPKQPTLFKDLYKEIIIGSPKTEGFFIGSR